jgi:hypothetical protein
VKSPLVMYFILCNPIYPNYYYLTLMSIKYYQLAILHFSY